MKIIEDFTNENPIYNKLGDTRNFGDFYEVIQNRKPKIVSFINSDISHICNPDLRQFQTVEQAYQTLLSYHIFHPYLYEDYLYIHSEDMMNLNNDSIRALDSIKNMRDVYLNSNEHGMACEILLYYEQKKKRDIIEEDSIERDKKRTRMNRRNTLLRLKSTSTLVDVGKGIRLKNYKFVFKVEK